jgi:transmembrane sensor
MSKVHSFTSKDAIREEACLWVSRIDRNLTIEEKAELRQWVSISSTHAIELKLAAEFWDETSVLQELSSLFPLQFSDNEPKNSYWTPVLAVACSAVFIALVLTFVPLTTTDQELVKTDIEQSQYLFVTSIGENRSFRLPDGSVAHLNTDSKLSIDYTTTARRLNLLKGEAHFDVTHDADRPFSVEADTLNVTAIGTAFNIALGGDDIELLVTDGKVLVTEQNVDLSRDDVELLKTPSNNTAHLIMSSGEKASLTSHQVKTVTFEAEKMSLADVQKELAWQQGMLVFQGERLIDVLEEIKRYNNINFDLSDQSLSDIQVAGYFKAGDIDGLINTLESNFNIQYERIEPNRIKLSSLVEL